MTDPDRFKFFQPDVPSPARMYDYYLGGKDHFPADREAAEKVINLMPPGMVRGAARQNRAFMQRAVRYIAAETGVRQFLDIGAGMPTMGPTHEVAQRIDPESRVVYVDYDPVVLVHGREMLSGARHAAIVGHDLRDPAGDVYGDPHVRRVIDLDRPVALLLVAILHFVLDEEDPQGIVRRLMEPLPSGSHLVLSHVTADAYPESDTALQAGYRDAMSRVKCRSKADVAKLMNGLDLIEPGLVWLPEWRPDADTGLQDAPHESWVYGAVARKP